MTTDPPGTPDTTALVPSSEQRPEVTPTQPTRVALVSRTRPTAAFVHAALDSAVDCTIIADLTDFRTAVERAFPHRPDVFILEAFKNTADVLELTRLVIARGHPRPPGVLLMAETEQSDLIRALWRGARGIVIGRGSQTLLRDSIRLVAAGHLVVPASFRSGVLEIISSQQLVGHPGPAALQRLTPRELDIVKLVTSGCSNAEVSTTLRLSESTVKSYIRRILDKLGVRNRVGIVILAYRAGLLTVSPMPVSPEQPDPAILRSAPS